MTTRTLRDYRPQHDEDRKKRRSCRWCNRPRYEHSHMHSFEPNPEGLCTCGLDELLTLLGEDAQNDQQEIPR